MCARTRSWPLGPAASPDIWRAMTRDPAGSCRRSNLRPTCSAVRRERDWFSLTSTQCSGSATRDAGHSSPTAASERRPARRAGCTGPAIPATTPWSRGGNPGSWDSWPAGESGSSALSPSRALKSAGSLPRFASCLIEIPGGPEDGYDTAPVGREHLRVDFGLSKAVGAGEAPFLFTTFRVCLAHDVSHALVARRSSVLPSRRGGLRFCGRDRPEIPCAATGRIFRLASSSTGIGADHARTRASRGTIAGCPGSSSAGGGSRATRCSSTTASGHCVESRPLPER